MSDTRIPYGANCTWWDSIDKVGHREGEGHRLPCCPHCGGMLFEVESQERWFAGAQAYEDAGNPGYVRMLQWARGKCFPSYAALRDAYKMLAA